MSFVNTLNIQRLVAAINLALITLGAYFFVTLFYQMVDLQIKPTETPIEGAETTSHADAIRVQPLSHYNPILERDLFKIGKEEIIPENKPSGEDVDDLENTKLKLKLWGTVSGDPEKAYAVIEDIQKREQNLYRVGDTIQEATVKMVLREKVVLTVNGKDVKLTMEELDQTPGGGGPRFASSRSYSPRMPSSMPQSPGEQRISINRSMVDEAFQDMNKLMTDIAITPHNENGELVGLNLNRIKPNSIFRRMGLRNGDVLMGVDGKPILSVEDAMQMYQSLQSASNVQVQVKRRGRDRTINYNIR